MAEKLIKSFTVGEDTGKVDYESLANKPFTSDEVADLKNIRPRQVKLVNYVEDPDKTDHRPAKKNAYCPITDGSTTTYVADAVELFRYACPEQIDIDSSIGEGPGSDPEHPEIPDTILKPETHLDYVKDGRAIIARDGDFGYPEVDKTGQFNFRPVWNSAVATEGYVINNCIVTDFDGKPHNDDKNSSDYNPCYNNFKTPWLTGIEGLYRFTKVCKDINIQLMAMKESEFEYNTLTYKIYAPEDYEGNIPTVRVFRTGDQVEKYYKYYLDANHATKYPTLSDELISGEVLEFTKQTTAEGQPQLWIASGISYDDSTGYPNKTKGKVILLIDTSNITAGYTVTGDATPKSSYKNFSAGDYGITKQITNITGDLDVILTLAPPVSVTYDQTHNVMQQADPSKLDYGFSGTAEDCPTPVASGSSFIFTLTHGEGRRSGWGEVGPKGAKYVVKNPNDPEESWVRPTLADALLYIDSITVGGVAVDKATAIANANFTTQKAKLTFNAANVTGAIVINLKTRPDLPTT